MAAVPHSSRLKAYLARSSEQSLVRRVLRQVKLTITVVRKENNMGAMNMKSNRGKSSVKAPKMGMKNSASSQISSGSHIVNKPINTHRANPGYGKKGV
jgi:hypothetical protein